MQTKLYASPPRAKIVPRPELITRFNSAAQEKLTLISAPAGYGKTTLLQSWLYNLDQKVAWLSIDDRDNDPTSFWAYLTAALQSAIPEIGRNTPAAINASPPPSIDELIIQLINELPLDQDIILVLDDYHHISSSKIHGSLQYFLEKIPPNIHLILASRADPPWPLARIRARREFNEFRANDLRFSHHETGCLLNEIMALKLDSDDVNKLHTRTEGWVAGLQMAALSFKGHDNLTALINDFSASNRHIFDYLVEEILANQTPEVKEFLIKTSFLNRLSAPLCDSLLDRANSSEVLDYLYQANIFLNPLDIQRSWYSYHGLFKDLLQNQLEIHLNGQIPELYRKASQWFADQRQYNEAISYAMLSNDYDQFALIAENNVFDLVQQQELDNLQKWLDKLPPDVLRERIWLSIAYCWMLVNTCRLDELQEWLNYIQTEIDSKEYKENQKILGHLYAIRSYQYGQKWDYLSAIELGKKALKHLPEDETARGWVAFTAASSWRKLGNLPAAGQAYNQAICFGEQTPHIQLQAKVGLGNIQLMRGKLYSAERSFRTILETTDQSARMDDWNPISGYVHSAIGSILHEWNQMETALAYTQEGVEVCERWGQLDYLTFSYVQHVFLLLSLGRSVEAKVYVQKIDKLLTVLPESPRRLMETFKLRFFQILGELDIAADLSRQLHFDPREQIVFEHALMYIIYARQLIYQGDYQTALNLLEKLSGLCRTAGAAHYLTEIMVIQSIALHKNRQPHLAESVLKTAIESAGPSGYVRTFIGEGQEIGNLLEATAACSGEGSYADKLLGWLKQETLSGVNQNTHSVVETLTPRECEVLQLLTTTQSVPEIADQMVVSTNTVRTHVQHIYDKLGVNRRRSAVQRAKQLNLV